MSAQAVVDVCIVRIILSNEGDAVSSVLWLAFVTIVGYVTDMDMGGRAEVRARPFWPLENDGLLMHPAHTCILLTDYLFTGKLYPLKVFT